MNFFRKLFGTSKKEEKTIQPSTNKHQLVVIQFFYGLEDLNDLHRLEHTVKQLLDKYELGHYHGHEISMDFGEGSLFFSSSNANDLFLCIQPVLESHLFMDNAIATIRNGDFDNEKAIESDKVIRFNKIKNL